MKEEDIVHAAGSAVYVPVRPLPEPLQAVRREKRIRPEREMTATRRAVFGPL